jgi:PTH1 family peptidyl-tRNA hydrolase
VKRGGGNAGHNGLRSISAHIGNEYARVRIGVGHPGSKDLVSGYVLHDFAKADQDWLEPLLDAMADAAGRLAAGDDARFLTDVARKLQPPKGGKDADAGEVPSREAPVKTASRPVAAHPAGERQSKRGTALAENLKKWLMGRKDT